MFFFSWKRPSECLNKCSSGQSVILYGDSIWVVTFTHTHTHPRPPEIEGWEKTIRSLQNKMKQFYVNDYRKSGGVFICSKNTLNLKQLRVHFCFSLDRRGVGRGKGGLLSVCWEGVWSLPPPQIGYRHWDSWHSDVDSNTSWKEEVLREC